LAEYPPFLILGRMSKYSLIRFGLSADGRIVTSRSNLQSFAYIALKSPIPGGTKNVNKVFSKTPEVLFQFQFYRKVFLS